MLSLNGNTGSISGTARTTYQPGRLLSSKIRLTISDIYYAVEDALEGYNYLYDSDDVKEYVASVLDMYLHTAERGFSRAIVDVRAAYTLFACIFGKLNDGCTSRIHNECIVKLVMNELGELVQGFDITRVYDYTLYGHQLAIVCLRRMEIKAVA